jgi:chromosome transmission fidelity protein 18
MQPIQDDNFLTKPNVAYDWLNFHDKLSSQVTKAQDWELAPYLSSTVLAFHHLFAASATARHTNGSDQKYGKDDEAALAPAPFFGPSAPYTASETTKTNNAAIVTLQSSLSLPLARLYRSHSSIASELLPYILRILAPDVKPVVINISTGNKDGRSAPTASVRKADEKERVSRAVECMAATGVRFERSKVEDVAGRSGGWVYRMEPGLDSLGAFETLKGGVDAVVRFAVRQVLEGEWRRRSGAARKTAAAVVDAEEVHLDGEKSLVDKIRDIEKSKERATKRDFFGRKVIVPTKTDKETGEVVKEGATRGRVWVSFHEGFSNAVRKPITLQEFLGAL